MNWQDKIYESLIAEKRSEASRRRTSLRKRGAEMDKRKAAGKSIGAYGAGKRASQALARGDETEAEKLMAHGRRYKANQEQANKAKRAETSEPERSPHGAKMSQKTKDAFRRAAERRSTL
jgi:hypothetical protein|tara:strand:+ start:1820 stop:2179 length:360 start_codon:yes stop_codon:yes gene_type:complete